MLVEEVGELQAEDAALPLVLRGGIEERHAFILISRNLSAHMVVVKREVEGGDGEDVDGTAVGERGYSVVLFCIAGARPAVTDVVSQFEPRHWRYSGIAMEIVVAGADFDDVSFHGPADEGISSVYHAAHCLP